MKCVGQYSDLCVSTEGAAFKNELHKKYNKTIKTRDKRCEGRAFSRCTRDWWHSRVRTGRGVASAGRCWVQRERKWETAYTSRQSWRTNPAHPGGSGPFPWNTWCPCGRNRPTQSPSRQWGKRLVLRFHLQQPQKHFGYVTAEVLLCCYSGVIVYYT